MTNSEGLYTGNTAYYAYHKFKKRISPRAGFNVGYFQVEITRERGARPLKLRKPATAAVFYTAGGITQKIAGVISTAVFTRLLLPYEFGLYSAFAGWMGIFTVFATLGLPGVAIYRGLQTSCGREREFLSSALSLLYIIWLTATGSYLLLSPLINRITTLSVPVTLALLVTVLGTGVSSLYLSYLRYRYSYLRVTLINLLLSVAVPGAAVVLILTGAARAEARIISLAAVYAAVAAFITFIIFRGGKKIHAPGVWRALLSTVLPLLPHHAALSAIAEGGTLIINLLLGRTDAAAYSLAFGIGLTPSVLTAAILGSLSPWILRRCADSGRGRAAEVCAAIFEGLCALLIPFSLLVPTAMRIIAPGEYSAALPAGCIAALTVPLRFAAGCASPVFVFLRREKVQTGISVGCALLFLCALPLTVPRLGYPGAAVATLISYALIAFTSALTAARLIGVKIPLLRISFFFLLTALSVTLSLYLPPIWRGVIFALSLIPPLFCALRLLPLCREAEMGASCPG